MSTDNEKPSTDETEQKALAIGERLMTMHPFMQIGQVDVGDGGGLGGRGGCIEASATAHAAALDDHA